MRSAAIAILVLCSTTAFADEPSAYQCAPGKPAVGQGCTCPAGYTSAREKDNIATCVVNAPVAPPMAKLTIEITGRFQPKAAAASPVVHKPDIDADSMMSIESLVGNVRPEQERILEQLIADTADSEVEEKADYYFRLGELQIRLYRFWRLKALEGKDPSAAGKVTDYFKKAIKTYEAMFANRAYRNYSRLDMALFYFAYTMQTANETQKARSAFERLLKEYPNSKYVPEAYLAFADSYFQSGQLAIAEEQYKKVLKFPASGVYWYAMYKVGWVHFQLKRFRPSFETFAQVIKATQNTAKLAPLHRAARKDFQRALAEHGKPIDAFVAMKGVDDKSVVEQMTSLAELHTSDGLHDHARGVYRELMTRLPGHASFCAWQSSSSRSTLSIIDGTKTKSVDVCKSEVDAFKTWATTNGLVVR